MALPSSLSLCAVDLAHGRTERAGIDWPMVEVAGRPVHKACAHEVEWLLEAAASRLAVVAGVARWTSNDQVPPADALALLEAFGALPAGVDLARCAEARDEDLHRVLAAYRAAQGPASAEERFELQAAFGRGAVVVDVLSGRRTTT